MKRTCTIVETAMLRFVFRDRGGVIVDSRCVRGRVVNYQWRGKPIEHVDGESAQRAVARWFAAMAANQEFAWGLLDSRRYNKYKMRLEAFVEEKLDRAVAGSLTPGNEVIFLAHSKRGDAPMFEFRWHRDARELRVGKREQIRHYDAEPLDLIDVVWGLHMHLKDVRSGDDELIQKAQNKEIDRAIAVYEQQASDGRDTVS